MAVKYGKAKKNPGKNVGESIFAAARKERKEAARLKANQERDLAAHRRATWAARQDILKRGFIKMYYTDERVFVYTEAAQMNPSTIDMQSVGDYYHFAAIKQAK